ncbi:hypothetical protein ACJX0J_034018, partial [Zea mays]
FQMQSISRNGMNEIYRSPIAAALVTLATSIALFKALGQAVGTKTEPLLSDNDTLSKSAIFIVVMPQSSIIGIVRIGDLVAPLTASSTLPMEACFLLARIWRTLGHFEEPAEEMKTVKTNHEIWIELGPENTIIA